MRSILVFAALAAMPVAALSQELTAGAQLAASCAMCHGTEGRSTGGNEPLAGMPKSDLVRKFADFRSGKRPATVMHQIAKGYTDAQVDQIAEYFSARRK